MDKIGPQSLIAPPILEELTMAYRTDAILEGVRVDEMLVLRALAEGQAPASRDGIDPLRDKGWIEMAGDVPLITLTGRALLEHPPTRLL